MVIFDKYPVSTTHFLGIPKQHSVTARDLKAEHKSLGTIRC
jgi:hypothetical protein